MKRREFMQYALDVDALTTPDGRLDPKAVRVAKLVRNRVRDDYAGTSTSSPAATVGGAVVGGVVAGPVGIVAGGLLGSMVNKDQPGESVLRTVSATVQIATDSVTTSIDVPLSIASTKRRTSSPPCAGPRGWTRPGSGVCV